MICFFSILHNFFYPCKCFKFTYVIYAPKKNRSCYVCKPLQTCSTDKAPFFPYPDVVTSSRSGSALLLNSSDRKAGSPITICPHGAMFQILSHTWQTINKSSTLKYWLRSAHEECAGFSACQKTSLPSDKVYCEETRILSVYPVKIWLLSQSTLW